MVDPGTGMVTLGIALGGKDIVVKLLGPTAEYLGAGMKDFAARRVENVKNIFANASAKLGSKIDNEGGVPPKVLRGVLEDGSYADDFLAVDYFGGVLASSRTGISRDDRGAYFNSLISRLSTYQLRLHYIAYHSLKSVFNGDKTNLNIESNRPKLKVFVSAEAYFHAMDFVQSEADQLTEILSHSIYGLVKEDLLDKYFQYGNADHLKQSNPSINSSGFIFQPTPLGIELFLWAYGKGNYSASNFLNTELEFKVDDKIKISGVIMKAV